MGDKTTLQLIAAALVMSTLVSCAYIGGTAPQRATQVPAVQDGRPGRVAIESPMPGSRYLGGEVVQFKARVPAGDQVQWESSIDGPLGNASQFEKKLSPGDHQVTAMVGGARDSLEVHVFQDLGQLYRVAPARSETDRVKADFNVDLVDGQAPDEKWGKYNALAFNQQSPEPSEVAALARLDVLRRQRFSQPLPFGGGNTAYDNLKNYVRTINLGLGCGISTGGGRTVNLNRNFSVWDSRMSGSAYNPDSCKTPLDYPVAAESYLPALYLLIHEGRHCEPGDTGHVTCKGNDNMDPSLEPGSGHARAALYLMWVYKYGLFDPPTVKEQARQIARDILVSRLCTDPAHSNPVVKAVLSELLPR